MLSNYLKNRVLSKYLKVLPLTLLECYGNGDYYSWGQITAAIKMKKLSTKYVEYAVAMFVIPKDLEAIFLEKYKGKDGKAVRKYIAEQFFSGNINFIVKQSSFSNVGNSGQDSMSGGTQPD